MEAPTVGWAKEAVWEVQTVSPLPETEGMEPCQVRDISFVKSPGVCIVGCAKSCLVDEKAYGVDWSQDAIQAVVWGARDVAGQRLGPAEHENP